MRKQAQTSVVTPSITSRSRIYNINIADNQMISMISYGINDKFIIKNKDGNIPDVAIDENTINMLIEAKRINNCMKRIEKYIAEQYPDLLDSKECMSAIVEYAKKHDWSIHRYEDELKNIIESFLC